MAKFCPECAYPISDKNAEFCPKCGVKLPLITPKEQIPIVQKGEEQQKAQPSWYLPPSSSAPSSVQTVEPHQQGSTIGSEPKKRSNGQWIAICCGGIILVVIISAIFVAVIPCPSGQFKGDDRVCYPIGTVKCNCGNNLYCKPDVECFNNTLMKKCPTGYFRGDDGNCHPLGSVKCNCEGHMYCEPGGECVNNRWMDVCPVDYFRADNGKCTPVNSVKCNCGGFDYCVPGGTCCNNLWMVCSEGYHIGYDCKCYSNFPGYFGY
jgi:hypothetical protein